jgi:hypothetical protein
MIKTSVTSTLKTEKLPLTLLQKGSSHLTSITTALSNKVVTAENTMPATSSGGAFYSMPDENNFVKIIPYANAATNTLVMRVTGWSRSSAGGYWIPHLLFYGTLASVGSSTTTSFPENTSTTALAPVLTINGTEPIFATISPTHRYAAYTSSNAPSGACVILDTMGCSLIEVEFKTTANTNTCNAFIGSISIY